MVIVTESELNILNLFNPSGTRLPHSKARKWLQNTIRSHVQDSPKLIRSQGKVLVVVGINVSAIHPRQYQIGMMTDSGRMIRWPELGEPAAEKTCPDWLWEALQEINGTRINSSNWK